MQGEIDNYKTEVRKLGNQLSITLKEFKELERQLLAEPQITFPQTVKELLEEKRKTAPTLKADVILYFNTPERMINNTDLARQHLFSLAVEIPLPGAENFYD